MTTNFHVSAEIQNKLKLDKSMSFLRVQDLNTLPEKKFDRVLYFMKEEENEESVMKDLMRLCNPEGLVLVCNVPEVNKRLSNGVLKYNKDVLTSVFNMNDIKRFWFLSAKHDHLFDVLVEAKN